ncbi:hypothetical protein Tcan_09612 [Toxocara canis]|uniref:Major sperm protein n=1 Tax=Toxocara canis TaxID=6265 RepID=A0A0B2VFA9_TOXCA|nr:hypothetical protein Tcan_09612 [Toxocara canis]
MNMPAAIRITPATAEVSTDGGTTKHQMECVGDQRVAFKIKIKSRYFKYYKPGKVGGNYLSIYYITAPSCYDPRMPFVKGAQIGEVKFKIMETLQDESALDDQGQDCQYDYLVVRESAVDSANKSKQDGKSIKKPEPKNPNKHDNNK